MTDANQNQRWRETSILSAATLGASAIVVLLFLTIADTGAGVEGYPVGFVLAATGLPVVLVLIVFWFIRRQEIIDRRHGLFED
jgi:putative solute:sodium symporter small subunit